MFFLFHLLLAQVDREAELFGAQPEPSSTEIPAALASNSLSDSMQIGGRLHYSLGTSLLENQKFYEGSSTNQKQADIYFDTRPNKNLRSFLRFRLSESSNKSDKNNQESASESSASVVTSLDELWVKSDIDNGVFFTFGRQHLKWGSGRFWNPTDFTAPLQKDPFAIFDNRLGQDLIKIHIPQEKNGNNYYLVLQFDSMKRNQDMGFAARGEWAVIGNGELALSFQARSKAPVQFGVDYSGALGPIDIHIESATSTNSSRLVYGGKIDPVAGTLPSGKIDKKNWKTTALLGFESTLNYNEDDNLNIGVETLYNQAGYVERDLEMYSLVTNQTKYLYSGRNYVGAYFRISNPGSWNKTTFILNGISNLSDNTSVARITGSWNFLQNLNLQADAGRCFGDAGELCFRIPPSYSALLNAPQIKPEQKALLVMLPTKRTLFTAGLALSLNF